MASRKTHKAGGDPAAQTRAESRLERKQATTLQYWKQVDERGDYDVSSNAVLDCGWGRLLFAHSFVDSKELLNSLKAEREARRDIAIYVRDPHVLLSTAPNELFLDPSHTYRLWFNNYRARKSYPKAFLVRRIKKQADLNATHKILLSRGSVPPSKEFLWESRHSKEIVSLVIEDVNSGNVLGFIMGVDHVEVFGDPERGSSFWSLAIDPQAALPGLGEALIRYLCEYFMARGRSFMDLSVMHDNHHAIMLYEKLGFERVPVFCVKRKNPINQKLYSAPEPVDNLNPYAKIIVNEARRRGIRVDIVDEKCAFFSLTFGARTVMCRESLSELTTAVAMSICDDKALTRSVLHKEGIRVPSQRPVGARESNEAFLKLHKRVVVKPARGEQGRGISVDVRTEDELKASIELAKCECDKVLLEEMIEGEDLRMVVINFELVAAATRKPAQIVGDGQHSVRDLIQKQSRRRAAATGGESTIPFDAETERCISQAGFSLDSILDAGVILKVRKTANLHTGGTIHDVTDDVHPELKAAAERAARALNIPVTGLDFIVPDIKGSEYAIIEANERPGLDNHQPQPTAERFVDMLFPETMI